MDWAGSYTLVTPRPEAVDGMSCISPPAPAPLCALGLKPDSCWMTASIRAAGTPYFCEAAWMSAAYGAAPVGAFAPAEAAGAACALKTWAKLVAPLVLLAAGCDALRAEKLAWSAACSQSSSSI